MFRRLAVLGTALSAVVALGPSASAADGWDVPHSARITIDGHGYGHGKDVPVRRPACREVRPGYRQIVGYYYPHTRWTTAAGSIRVWISRDLTNDVQVAARPA